MPSNEHWRQQAKRAEAAKEQRTWVWPAVALVVVAALIAGILIYGITKGSGTPSASPSATPTPSPTATVVINDPLAAHNVTVIVTGTATAPTMAVRWTAPTNATAKTTYKVHYATARLSDKVGQAPFQSPCLQLSKTTADTKVVLPAPFNKGVFYVDVTASTPGVTSPRSAPVIVYGPFSAKQGQTFTATRGSAGAIPAFEWCRSQNLTS